MATMMDSWLAVLHFVGGHSVPHDLPIGAGVTRQGDRKAVWHVLRWCERCGMAQPWKAAHNKQWVRCIPCKRRANAKNRRNRERRAGMDKAPYDEERALTRAHELASGATLTELEQAAAEAAVTLAVELLQRERSLPDPPGPVSLDVLAEGLAR